MNGFLKQLSPAPTSNRLPMTQEQRCFRCNAQILVLVESFEGVAFFECPECKRHYALKDGRTLTDQWLSPITLPLYETIFSLNPSEDAERIACSFLELYSPERLGIILADIDDELASPKQCLQYIFDQTQSEESLRLFLRKFAEHVANHLEAEEH